MICIRQQPGVYTRFLFKFAGVAHMADAVQVINEMAASAIQFGNQVCLA
jgi:hypothetical protein